MSPHRIYRLSTRRLAPHNLETGIRALHIGGLVSVTNLTLRDRPDGLNATMVRDADVLQAARDNSLFDYDKGQHPVTCSAGEAIFMRACVRGVFRCAT